jgi:hypothetical protein
MQTDIRKRDLSKTPKTAFSFALGRFEFDADQKDKDSVSVSLLARTKEPIEHWWWGRVVHDISGVRHRDKIPIDYAHDDREVIGYVDGVETEGDLVLHGALVPFTETDRASEVIHKSRAGIPYQASIYFGDDAVFRYLGEGEKKTVNGFDFEGPGVIVEDWELRGVAVCPYGADGGTATNVFADGGGTRKITLITGDAAMAKKEKTKLGENAEAIVEINEKIEAINEKIEEVAENIEEVTSELDEAAEEVEKVEAEVEGEVEGEDKEDDETDTELSADRREFAKMAKHFGAAIATTVFARGGNYADAMRLAYKNSKKKIEKLTAQVEKLKKGARPAAFAAGDGGKESAWDKARKRR